MKKRILQFILILPLFLISCGHTRFKTYRSISMRVIDKKAIEEKNEYDKRQSDLMDKIVRIKQKLSRGLRLDGYESYDSLMYAGQLKYPGTFEYHPHDILFSGIMNPEWIEVTSDFIIFKKKGIEEVKKFKVTSIDKQEGIEDADWLIEINDSEIKKAILSDHVLQLNSGANGHYDYTYTFNSEKKNN